MSTTERIILDPDEITTSRTELDITPWVNQAGADWGDAQITAFMAERDRGSFPVDFSIPNRDITIPLTFGNVRGGTANPQARANIQAKIGLFQREGGWIKRVLNSGGTVYADVVDAATHGFASAAGWESGQDADIDPSISLTTLPDFYQDEVILADHAETSAAELVFTETSIDGDYPARVRIAVDDDQGADQKGLVWGFRSRYYDSASTARLTYEAEALGALDTAAGSAVVGASGGSVMYHSNLATNWTPVMSTNIAGTQFLTHRGTYRLYARVASNSGTTVQARFAWDVGDLVNPTLNDPWRIPGSGNYFVHDFGEFRLDAPPVGTYRWQGQIQAKGDAGGENFAVDKIWLVPVDEGMGVLTAPTPTGFGVTSYSARDEFNQTSGTVTGKVLPVGGTWTSAGTACDTTDYNMDTTNHWMTRTATSDTGTGASVMVGRGLTAGTANYASISTSLEIGADNALGTTLNLGSFARFVDTSNYLAVLLTPTSNNNSFMGALFGVYKVKAGVITTLKATALTVQASGSTYYTVSCTVLANGQWGASLAQKATAVPLAAFFGSDGDLAAGGTLATGKIGIVDSNATASAATRYYDNFTANVPLSDAVIFANESMQLTSDGNFRLDSTGSSYGPVAISNSDLPRLPVSGLDSRTTEILIKGSRGDFDLLPDSHTSGDYGDDISARVFYRPCYLNVGPL